MCTPRNRRSPWLLVMVAALALTALGCTRARGDSADGIGAATTDVGEVTVDFADCFADQVFCIGVVTGPGGVDDGAIAVALDRAERELGARVSAEPETDITDVDLLIGVQIDRGVDMVVLSGGPSVAAEMGEAVVAAAERHEGTQFVVIGSSPDVSPLPANVAVLALAERDAGFLAGSLAALVSVGNAVSAVAGTDLEPSMVAMTSGFSAGVAHVSSEVAATTVMHPGAHDLAFIDPEWGAAAARAEIEAGSDVVVGIGGVTGTAAMAEAAVDAPRIRCIGIGVDHWNDAPPTRPCLAGSVVYDLDAPLFALIEAGFNRENLPLGLTAAATLAPLHGAASSTAIADRMVEIEAGLVAGTISTG